MASRRLSCLLYVILRMSHFSYFGFATNILRMNKNNCTHTHTIQKSVWYGAILRGDVNVLTVGNQTSIGDRAVVHVAKIQGDFATHIGNHVTVGAGALIHAATLQDSVIIGESAQVLDGAVVESNSIVAPSSIVTPGTKVTGGHLWAGSPAKMVRALTEAEIASIGERASDTVLLAAQHAMENAKDYKQILEEEELADIEMYMDDPVPTGVRDPADVQGQGHPGRIFRSTLSHPEEAHKQFEQKTPK